MHGALLLRALLALSALDALEPSALTVDDPAIELRPTAVRYVETRWVETVIRGKPWAPHPRIATVASGTRLAVRGEVSSRDSKGCDGEPWYAVHPFGYVCSQHVRTTTTPPSSAAALPVREGERLPFRYAMVRADGTPGFADAEVAASGLRTRTLEKGMSVAIARSVAIAGLDYVQTLAGELIPRESVGYLGQGSAWTGVVLEGDDLAATTAPRPLFAWVGPKGATVWSEPRSKGATKVERLDRRTRLDLVEALPAADAPAGRPEWYRLAPAPDGTPRWVRATELNEVFAIPPPRGVLPRAQATGSPPRGDDRWIDVDTGEQVLVAYRGATPVFATLTASGRGHPTPRGDYPIWAKVAAIDMNNQAYEDGAYEVQGVPWVLLFQGHNALHGAYWHDQFGQRKSHGCVNLAPHDARWVFEWVGPHLAEGWTGYLPSALDHSIVVHVRDSSRTEGDQFTQDRRIGPPDPTEEADKLAEAEQRRALAAGPTAGDADNPAHEGFDGAHAPGLAVEPGAIAPGRSDAPAGMP
jgi:hypothetical protein